MDDFETVCTRMRAAGIGLCIGMVLNHTARKHAWARAAVAGDAYYRDLYLLFGDETEPLAYERRLIEVFPGQASGNFIWDAGMGKWVWTTFNTFQRI